MSEPNAPHALVDEPAPVEPPRPRGRLGLIIAGVAVVVLLAIAGIVYSVVSGSDSAAKAKEGDCLAGDEVSTEDTKPVKLNLTRCDASDARYKVVGLVPGLTDTQVKNELCQPFVEKGATVIYWQEASRGADKGNVLCLAPAK
jgi:hypothetical protein